MTNNFFAWLVVFVVLAPSASGTPAHKVENSAAPGKQETMLTIKSSGDLGPMEINMSSLGLRLKGKIGNSLWRPSDPQTAILINPENKTYLAVPVEEYIRDLRDEDFPVIIADFYKTSKATLPDGFRGTEYTVIAKREDGSERLFAKVIGLKKSGVPEATHRMWCQYAGFVGPDIGLPVSIYRVRGHGHGGRHRRNRSTSEERVEKLKALLRPIAITRSPIVASYFVPPPTYKKAKDRAALYLSQDGDMKQSDMEDFFRVPLK